MSDLRLAAPASLAWPETSIASATSASGAFERLVTIEMIWASSPAMSWRGSASRATTSLVTSVFAIAFPTSVRSLAPRAVKRQVVRLSGHGNFTWAWPAASVWIAGAQNATSRKSRRGSSRPPLSAPP